MSTPQNAVTAEAGNSSATIHARVGDSAIDKVTRLFSASLADIFTETLQNSRRGGANRVAATIEQDGDTTRVTLIDDGAGIADPAVLLTFGESGWKAGIAEAEDPAGFGLLALSRRGCTLRWRLPGLDPSPGYRLVLEPAHFLGRDAAHVVADDSAPWPHGTAVTFEASEAPHAVRAFLETAARHYPLPVTIGGETVERCAFLDGALHVEPWKGLVFGVFKDSHAGYRVPDVNFHGLTLPVRLPQIDTVEGGVWSARADIDSCADLELVLPARKEAVETPFLEDMREAARLAVYRAMAQADPAPRVAWTDWHKAKEAGIEMPVPPAELRPWRPAIADTDYWDERSAFAGVGTDVLVMQADPEPPEAQALHRALGLTGLQGGSERALRLFAPEARFEGYPWYDALARVTGIETLVTVDGAVRSLDYFTNRENGGEPERPETIVMHLNILHPPESPRHCFRKCGTIAVPADLAFAGEAWSSLHDALPLVTADSGIAPEELARLLRAAYFSPSDDAEADSWETQLTRFEEEALHMSLKLMCSVEEARQRTIADAVWREIFWLMPRDRTVTIVVRGGYPRRRPAIPEHADDRPRHHLSRLHAAPERTRRHPRAPGRGASTLRGMGTARGSKIDDRAAGCRRRCPQICRRPHASARPRRPARHPVARRGRPHPLGAAGLPAAHRRSRPLAHQPRRAAVGGADGAGRPVSARARPQGRRIRTARRSLADRLRQPRIRPRRRPPHADAAGIALRPSGDQGRCGGLACLGGGERNFRRDTFLYPDAPGAVAPVRPAVAREGFSVSPDVAHDFQHRAAPGRPSTPRSSARSSAAQWARPPQWSSRRS